MIPTTMQCLFFSSSKFLLRYPSIIVFGFTLVLASTTLGFNLDVPSAVHQFNADAFGGDFGASVVAYEDQGRPWTLVGAPLARNRLKEPSGQGFRCNVYKNICGRIPIKPRGPPFQTVDQGLGTTVAAYNKSWNTDGVSILCAPRLRLNRQQTKNSTDDSIDGTGECYAYLGMASDYTKINPCKSHADMGSCLSGFSASLDAVPSKNYIQIALGMPGAFRSEGNVFLGTYRENGVEVNQVMLKMRKGDWSNKGFTLGYSIVLANLRPLEKTENDIITSSPMWVDNGYRGVIVVTDKNMQSDEALVIRDTMGHVGSFFGHSLAAMDLNGDSILDLVVGSPYFSASRRIDVGRVYILYGTSRGGSYAIKGDPVVLEGPNPDGRFGHAVAKLGDIDGDGLSDLGVGCPYCGEDRRGAVFIYLSKRGKLIGGFADQVIYASSVLNNYMSNFTDDIALIMDPSKLPKASPLRTFGWSLSGGADFDKNSVPDLAVGARRSDIVTFMRGKPTGRLFLLSNKTRLPRTVTMDGFSCQKIIMCRFSISFTLQLDTWPTSETRVFPFEFTFDFDSMLKRTDEKRARLVDDPEAYRKGVNTPVVTLKRNYSISRQPEIISFSLEPIKRRFKKNRWQPIRITFHARPLWPQNYSGENNLEFNALPLILHPDSLSNYSFRDIYITNRDCSSKVCKSDIFVKVTERLSNSSLPGVVYYGATREVRHLQVIVGNRGEPAYNTRLLFRFPKGVHYMSRSRYQCTEIETTNLTSSESEIQRFGERTTVECILPATIRRTSPIVRIWFVVKPSMAILSDELRRRLVLLFSAEALSENPDTDRSNNIGELRYDLRVYSRVQLDPSTESGEAVVIDRRNVTLQIQSKQLLYADSIGPELRHVYRLTNFGPSPASRVDVNITVPLYSQAMQQLLYILPRVKSVRQNSEGKSDDDIVSTMPRVVTSDGEKRGECAVDQRFVDLYQLRALQSVKRSLVSRRRRSTDYSGAGNQQSFASVESTRARGETSSEASTQRGSFLSAWKSRRVEEVRCDLKDSEFGDIFCVTVRCTVHNLTRNEVVRIVFEARLWADTYFRAKTSDVAISTEAYGRLAPTVDGIPVSGPLNLTPLRIQQTFIFHGIQNLVTKQIPWWPILVATFLGLVLLGLIIVVMWKCGFFKRHRPSDKEFQM